MDHSKKQPDRPTRKRKIQDKIDEAAEESFPASDPPSWSPTEAGNPPERDQQDKKDGR